MAHKYSQYNCRRTCVECLGCCGDEGPGSWVVTLPWGATYTVPWYQALTDPTGCEYRLGSIPYACSGFPGTPYTDGELQVTATVQAGDVDGELQVALYRRTAPEVTEGPVYSWSKAFGGRPQCGQTHTLEEQVGVCPASGDVTITQTGCCACSCTGGSSGGAVCGLCDPQIYRYDLEFSGPGGWGDRTVAAGTVCDQCDEITANVYTVELFPDPCNEIGPQLGEFYSERTIQCCWLYSAPQCSPTGTVCDPDQTPAYLQFLMGMFSAGPGAIRVIVVVRMIYLSGTCVLHNNTVVYATTVGDCNVTTFLPKRVVSDVGSFNKPCNGPPEGFNMPSLLRMSPVL